jgi:CheY-like chemotaxis protein
MAQNEIRHRAKVERIYGRVPRVDANEGRLGQVFLNLIVNATQAIPEGNADDNEIGVATRTDGAGNVVVEVRDSGQGIAPEHRARLFDPFFTTKPVGVGTGLGLSICHNIIAAHGGTIEVESEVGKGSMFRVILRPSAIVTAFEEPPPPPPPGRRGRILVVDDEPMVVASVARLLSPEHEVVTVTAARDALTHLDEGDRFDLILCDLMMPEMTGMDLLEELARTHPDQAERMVFTTGGAFTPRAQEFLDATPHQRIEKPFTSQGLRAAVRSQLARFPPPPARTDAEPAPRPVPVDEEARPTGRRRRAAKASAS